MKPRWTRATGCLLVATGALTALTTGCKDPHLAGAQIPHVTVAVVHTPDGVTLNENSSPVEVAYAFLRAARDDYLAARGDGKRDEQKAAFGRQIQLAAARRITADLDRTRNRKTLPVQHSRDESVFQIVRVWTPIVAYYVDDFAADRDDMVGRMRTNLTPSGDAIVYVDVSHGNSHATVQVLLSREPDDEDPSKRYWRIYQVGFADPRAQTSTPRVIQLTPQFQPAAPAPTSVPSTPAGR